MRVAAEKESAAQVRGLRCLELAGELPSLSSPRSLLAPPALPAYVVPSIPSPRSLPLSPLRLLFSFPSFRSAHTYLWRIRHRFWHRSENHRPATIKATGSSSVTGMSVPAGAVVVAFLGVLAL
ncbi:hypothetical protein MSAN_02137400 [Mycena sanguinolenta]|uniref:Uncharacterized protein n=1 Tax=Mycena sanguinolenta TaxID=230812 RepID=A0A8H6XHR1_9AGAR|nr:hypothetical protein MSAN_02137400 [Mycena sanguinolenta]